MLLNAEWIRVAEVVRFGGKVRDPRFRIGVENS